MERTSALRNACYFAAGIGFLSLAKAKSIVRGYSTPKPFALTDTERCIDYDLRTVDAWLRALASYSGGAVAGQHVLELGPGSDLGVGLTLLARGASSYTACDVHDLATRAPGAFYDALLARLQQSVPGTDLALLRQALDGVGRNDSALRYRVLPSFDLTAAAAPGSIDLVFSQAAFEHFDDVDDVVGQLTTVCRPGAVLIAEIDLKTHSRWVRDHDPNNIYRFPDPVYRTFRFRGSPNRMRPYQYRRIFERHGWKAVRITPLTQLDSVHGSSGMAGRFTGEENQMEYLTILLSATRGPGF